MRWVAELPGVIGHPVLGSDDSIWVLGTDDAVHYSLAASIAKELTWERIPLPAGQRPIGLVAGEGSEIHVTARRGAGGQSYILALRRGPDEVWRVRPFPGIGAVSEPALDADGRLWVGGEWGEVFRLEGERWVKELLPLPYHVQKLVMFAGGEGWALLEHRGLNAVCRRSEQAWGVAARSELMTQEVWTLVHATTEAAFVRGSLGLMRVSSEGAGIESLDPGFPPSLAGAVALSGPATGWVWSPAGLFFFKGGEWTALPLLAGPIISRLTDLGAAGLFAIDRESRLVRLEPCTADRPASLERRRLEPLVPPLGASTSSTGVAVLTLHGQEHLYLVDEEDSNPTVQLGMDPRGGMDPGFTWRSFSGRLGNGGPHHKEGGPTYDQTALAADLDGDGDEDLVLLAMHDLNQVLLNVGDDHFVDWTREAGLQGTKVDDSIGGCLLDAEGDGDLDLYVANALRSDRLHLNNGAASFREASPKTGVHTTDRSQTAACTDLDGDGDTDIAVATWGRGLVIHENLGAKEHGPRFRTRRLLTRGSRDDPLAFSDVNLNSVVPGDLDADGLPELLCTVRAGRNLLLRNLGRLEFDPRPLLPEPAESGGDGDTLGGSFVDLGHDGDLDLILTGAALRFYVNQEGVFLIDPRLVADVLADDVKVTTGSALFDLDEDGDLDVFVAAKRGHAVVYRNRIDDRRWIMLRLVGPPANRSAVGAQLRLFPAGKAGDRGSLLAWRQVAGASGYCSMDSKWVHFGGVDPDSRYDIVASLPGAGERLIRDVRPHARHVFYWEGDRARAWAGGIAHQTARFFAGFWNRRWASWTGITWAGLALLVWRLHHRARPSWAVLLVLGAYPVFSLALLVALPLNPGAPAVGIAVGSTAALALIASALLPRASVGQETPELAVELSVTLRAFQHNETPRRILDHLRFVLENLGDATQPLEVGRAALLREDLAAFRDVVLPQVEAISHLSRTTGLGSWSDLPAVDRCRSVVGDLLRGELKAGVRLPLDKLKSLQRFLGGMDLWLGRVRRDTERRLSVDLRSELAMYVSSREGVAGCPIDLDLEGTTLRARVLPTDLQMVLDTLVENAGRVLCHHADPRIRIEARRIDCQRILVSVADPGPGVPVELRDKLFELGSSGEGDGRGFGLHYARRTVERYGGSIALDSSVKQGARFVIELRAAADERPGPGEAGP